MLMQAYETTFGIFDHIRNEQMDEVQTDISKKRPIAAVAMHAAEDYSGESQLYETIRTFADKEISKLFGLSLIEFLNLPHDVCEHILDICIKKQDKDIQATNAALSNLGRTS